MYFCFFSRFSQYFWRGFSVWIFLLLSILTGCSEAKIPAVIVSEDGRVAPIIIAKDAFPHTVEAATELARFIERISGYKPEIIHEPPQPWPHSAIWIGPHPELKRAMSDVDLSLTKQEETLIVSKNGHIAILGNDRMAGEKQIISGTANAVYTFAQDVLGVRWLWPGETGEDVVKASVISVPSQVLRYAPIFLQRDLVYRTDGPIDALWTVHQRLVYDSYKTPLGHAFDDWWEKYSVSHPEYFALQPDGTRSGFPSPRYAKVCEGEPGVWRQWLKNVEEEFTKNPTKRVFGATQNDASNSGICLDPRSKAWDHPDGPLQQYEWKGKVEKYVAMSDRTVHFANTLGEMLEKRFPKEDLRVAIMAYGPSKPAPIEAHPRKNVVVSYVGQFPISGDKWREIEKKQFAEWSEKADFMVYRPNLFYYSGGWHGLPVVALRNTEEDFQFLADHHCRGIAVDGFPNHYGTQGLQYYVMAQLMWNPYQSAEAVADDFCRRGFGPAASKVRAYYALMERAQMAVLNHPEWFPGMGTTRDPLSNVILPEAYTKDLLDQADQLLSDAADELKESPEIYRKRLDLLERAQKFTRLTMDIVLVMNDVRRSQGRDVAAVEKAVELVKARDVFFKEETRLARTWERPPAINPRRIQVAWIDTRKLQDWLGPVSEDFLRAAAKAKETGNFEASSEKLEKATSSQEAIPFVRPLVLRWTGAAGDKSWQNRKNWEALTQTAKWTIAPEPPGKGAKVELGDALAHPGPQTLQLGRDVELESISLTAVDPRNSYRIEDKPDTEGGIDSDSGRLNTLTLKATTPITQTQGVQASVEFDVEVQFSDPRASMKLESRHPVKVYLRKAKP